eukprot:SM000147S01104  [mRNA]  locus=s147:25909:30376:- [translate_table: standard]
MPYISQHGAEALRKYKYSGLDKSYVSKYVLNPFWQRFVLIFPLWVAPNTVTLIGFGFIVASGLISYYYSPQLVTPSPKWIYFIHGLFLFLYQTFDAVDGKQARRTNSSSPLGELFDHGCDALTCAFESLAFGSAVLSGRNTLGFWAVATIPFYFATWETYYTHTLLLPVVNGPTEGLMIMYFAYWFTAIVGGEWWTLDFRKALRWPGLLPMVPDIPTNEIAYWVMFIPGVIPTAIANFLTVRRVVLKGQRGSMLQALGMLLPYCTLLSGAFLWKRYSPSDVMGTQPHLFILGTGLAFGLMVGRIILSHLCDEVKGLKTNLWTAMLILPVAIANALSAKHLGGVVLQQHLIMSITFSSAGFLYFHFVVNVIREICQILDISCFRVRRAPRKAS